MPDLTAGALKQSVLDHVEQLGASAQEFPWENKTAYGYWLAQTYYFVRHTTSFLSLTASRFGPWERDRQYFQLRHLKEESGHDQLLLDDLDALGLRLEAFIELPEEFVLASLKGLTTFRNYGIGIQHSIDTTDAQLTSPGPVVAVPTSSNATGIVLVIGGMLLVIGFIAIAKAMLSSL